MQPMQIKLIKLFKKKRVISQTKLVINISEINIYSTCT